MAAKRIVYNEEARHALMRGVNKLADAVKVTVAGLDVQRDGLAVIVEATLADRHNCG